MSFTINQWQAAGKSEKICGYDIFYRDTGENERTPLLLIHGFPTSSWDWGFIWESLNSRFRLIAPDMLGFGFSEKPNPHKYSIMEQADIVDGLVKKLGLKSFHVLAHDYGDTVAQELLARENDRSPNHRWLSLCLLNGGLFPETHQARLIQKLLLSPFGFMINRFSSKKTFDKSFSSVFGDNTKPSAADLDAFWELINYNNGRHLFHNLITYMSDRKQHRNRWVSCFLDSCAPLGLINGSMDPVSGAHMVSRFKELIGEEHFFADMETIGHYPHVEDEKTVAKHYLCFIDSISNPDIT